jgi:hypothetical protein
MRTGRSKIKAMCCSKLIKHERVPILCLV